MINMLKAWAGSVEVDGTKYDDLEAFKRSNTALNDVRHIILYPKQLKPAETGENVSKSAEKSVTDVKSNEIQITVKKYMTEQSSPRFDFMAKWNNDNPMPCRIMAGVKVKETRGMVYMKLHALSKPTITCTCCGKELTNPISRHYGIGPICLGKMGIVRDIEDVESIREELVNVTWEGWIIKSAITAEEEI